jgi:alginate O-acetyltransferase complex protein AlgI
MLSLPAQMILYGVALPVAWLLSWRLREGRARQLLYLVLSYLFYATWGLWFLGVLILGSLGNYLLGQYLRRKPSVGRLWIGIGCNVALLSVFKYLPEIGRHSPASPLGHFAHLVLPIGMSFWTFQALSYLFDLYREEELDPSMLEFCLYMAFWPTVLSGPICRLPAMLPQFRQPFAPGWGDVARGIQRIGTGLLMMMLSQVLASGLHPGKGLDQAFALPATQLSGLDVWLMITGYGLQLFFNFCGYSHLVIGAARLFGFALHENFNRPFLSTSPSEFWTRWHMSLSFWIRDYMFFPLATLRAGLWWRNLCLVIAMFLFGLWHKGSLLFLLWGTYHGLLLVAHRQWQQVRFGTRVRLPRPLTAALSWAGTFAAVSIGWIFFRAADTTQAAAMLRAAIAPQHFIPVRLPVSLYGITLLLGAGYFLLTAAGSLRNAMEHSAVPVRSGRAFEMLTRDGWVWMAPLSVVISLYVLVLLRPTITVGGPMLYRLF